MKYILFISCWFILFLVSCEGGVDRLPSIPNTVSLTAEPTPYKVALRNGQIVQLPGGIHQEIVDQLKSGETAYLVLAFETPGDQTVQSIHDIVRNSGITIVSYDPGEFTSFLAVVPPESLSTLQDWSKNGLLRAAAPLPSDAKLNPKLAEQLKADPQGTMRVSIQLFVFPEIDQKEELRRFFQDVYFPPTPGVRSINGEINKENIPPLLELPYVIFVSESYGGIILPTR